MVKEFREMVDFLIKERRKQSLSSASNISLAGARDDEEREIVMTRFEPFLNLIATYEAVKLGAFPKRLKNGRELIKLDSDFTINGLNKSKLSRATWEGSYKMKAEFLVEIFGSTKVSAEKNFESPNQMQTVDLARLPEYVKERIEENPHYYSLLPFRRRVKTLNEEEIPQPLYEYDGILVDFCKEAENDQ